MKKFLALVMAMMMVLAMGTVAFADGETTTTPTYTDMSTVTLTKEYKLTNAGTTSPAETFSFSALTCTGIENAGVGVTVATAPVPTIGNVAYTQGEAGSTTAKKTITITLPTYTAVGTYTYTFTENDGNTAGVTYRSAAITLVVHVIEQDGKVRVAAVHTEGEGEAKSAEFNNEYSAGSLVVKKNVTGIMGDQQKDFTVKVTFTAPEGDTVREAITYVDGTETKTIAANWNDSKEATITLKHDETVTFTNIPYGVTYTVTENDYTAEAVGGYDAAKYDTNQNGTINAASVSTIITNNKDGEIPTGINMDNAPYMMIMAMVVLAGVAMMMKKRAYND